MPLKTQFQIVESPTQISEPITKFGGQPVWITESLWPLDPETGEQMMFLGQISLSRDLFPNSDGTMVYLFLGGGGESTYNGVIATVIQTLDNVYTNGLPEIEFVSEVSGPSIFELDEDRQPVYKEYKALLNPIENEQPVPLKERYTRNDLDYDTGFNFAKPELAGNKLGGQPLYIETITTPPEQFFSEEWLLLLQLAPTQGYENDNFQPNFYPFYMELGAFGILTIFISKNYTQTVCYIQQP